MKKKTESTESSGGARPHPSYLATWLLLRMRHTAIMEYVCIYIYIHMLSYTIHKHTNYGEYQKRHIIFLSDIQHIYHYNIYYIYNYIYILYTILLYIIVFIYIYYVLLWCTLLAVGSHLPLVAATSSPRKEMCPTQPVVASLRESRGWMVKFFGRMEHTVIGSTYSWVYIPNEIAI